MRLEWGGGVGKKNFLSQDTDEGNFDLRKNHT